LARRPKDASKEKKPAGVAGGCFGSCGLVKPVGAHRETKEARATPPPASKSISRPDPIGVN